MNKRIVCEKVVCERIVHDKGDHDSWLRKSRWLMRYLSKAHFRPGFALRLLPAELRCGGDGHEFHREQRIVGSPWWWGAHRGEATFLPLHHSLVDLDVAPRVYHLEAAPAPRCHTQESCTDSGRGCTWLTPPWPSIRLAASEVLCMPSAMQLGFLPGISDFQEERGGQSDRWQMTEESQEKTWIWTVEVDALKERGSTLCNLQVVQDQINSLAFKLFEHGAHVPIFCPWRSLLKGVVGGRQSLLQERSRSSSTDSCPTKRLH